MTQQEFFNRTGVEINNNQEWWTIVDMYNNCEVDKDEFCKLWCKMNPNRVKNARIERKEIQRNAAYKDALTKWFNKYRGTQFFYDNYHTNIAYIKLSVYLVRALSYANIRIESGSSFSDVHFKVGQYLGIYRSL